MDQGLRSRAPDLVRIKRRGSKVFSRDVESNNFIRLEGSEQMARSKYDNILQAL